ncbi:MAG TPA: hypothetical protein EYN44_20065 [Marinobacter salarius]|uniref:DUF2971 domain-containing protein n=1 Tax=Alloalcanivorax xenomutans TaxID=1094342 RepID=A0A9Q3W573_9GAMM|nr:MULTISPECIES: hypothetical protein [Gammaproteobacteria]MCE7508866.1 hypothetical protein [Alloalcanivorax xenomutans]HIP01875.1 hypothetical protein [Marinobacter salarius]
MSVVIQRYMDLTKFVNLIQTRSLYLAKMSAFEDALEGGLTVDGFFETSNAAAIIDLALNGHWPAVSESATERANRLEETGAARNEAEKKQFNTPFGSYPRDEAERLFPACKEWLYVSCWHQSEHECAAMWRLYGRDKNSVCVFSTDEQLAAAIVPDRACNRLEIQRVNYISHIDDTFSDNPLDPFISKSKPYAFEREIRIVSWNSDIDLSKSPRNKEPGCLFEVDLGRMIQKVVVSPHADLWFKDTVKMLCEDAGINVTIEDSVMRMPPISDIYQAMAYNKLRKPDA